MTPPHTATCSCDWWNVVDWAKVSERYTAAKAGIAERRRKVPHSLRSNFKQGVEKTLLDDNLQKRLLGHSTGDVKDEHYNETDLGPAFPSAQVLPFLEKVDFGLTLPKWSEVCELRVQAARGNRTRR